MILQDSSSDTGDRRQGRLGKSLKIDKIGYPPCIFNIFIEKNWKIGYPPSFCKILLRTRGTAARKSVAQRSPVPSKAPESAPDPFRPSCRICSTPSSKCSQICFKTKISSPLKPRQYQLSHMRNECPP